MPLYVRTLWITVPAAMARAAADAHRRHLRELHAAGQLRAAGEFRDGDGFLEILAAKDRLEAEALARRSPLIEEGLCAWTLREWVERAYDAGS